MAHQDNMHVTTVLPRLVQPARVALLLGVVVFPSPVSGSDAVQQLTVRANLETATALRVSSRVLVFDVATDDGVALASVDYVASARTGRAGEVILSVETTRSVEGPGGAADPDSTLTVGEQPTPIAGNAPVVAERWIGGGTRSGRLVFTFRAAAAGRYVVPVRVVLSIP